MVLRNTRFIKPRPIRFLKPYRSIENTTMPATDCGLDSSGNPFCGIGSIETGTQCAAKRLEHN